jgi:opacity protein-like surface antigen
MRFRTSSLPVLAAALALLLSCSTAGAADPADSGSGIRGWGPRVGLASDPDQFLVGVHIDAGRLAPRVRFQPDVELGFGDEFFLLGFTAPVHYRFEVNGNVKPYAGGGVTLGYVNVDIPEPLEDLGVDDDDIEFAIDIIGGVEWALRSGNLFFVEFDILAGDLHDFQLVGGWTFR